MASKQFEIDQFEAATKEGRIHTTDRPSMEKSVFDQAITNTLVKLENFHNIHFKEMIFKEGQTNREKGKLLTQLYKEKAKYKDVALPKTSDFVIEMVNKIKDNLNDANKQKIQYFLKMLQIDDTTHEKNMQILQQFLYDVKDGVSDVLVDGNGKPMSNIDVDEPVDDSNVEGGKD